MKRTTLLIASVGLLALVAIAASVAGGVALGRVLPPAVVGPEASSSHAPTPPALVSFQGLLTNPMTGEPVADGPYSIAFAIYDVSAGGVALWTETQPAVAVSGGVFSVLLGSVTPLPGDVFAGAERYLGVTVGGDPELTPRQRFTAVAYAFHSLTADSADSAETLLQDGVVGLRMEPNATSPSLIGGFSANSVTSGVVGGAISGGGASGQQNVVSDNYGTIGGGITNAAGNADVDPTNRAHATVGGGSGNEASGARATVGGGLANVAGGTAATVGGGDSNSAGESGDTVGGGILNTASGSSSTVGGGSTNTASGPLSTVGGGGSNTAGGQSAVVGGGDLNMAGGFANTIGGGQGNSTTLNWDTVAGGLNNSATGGQTAVGGGSGNTASAQNSTVAGGSGNSASAVLATVGGGQNNAASNSQATVAGGIQNTASGPGAAVGGGQSNTASGSQATVSGGIQNAASGNSATVPGGGDNSAAGDYSLAAGRRARVDVLHFGSFLFADSNLFDFNSAAANEFAVRSVGGARVVTAIDMTGVPTAGVKLDAGDTAWEVLSDRAAKENFAAVDPLTILERLAGVPIEEWNYIAQDDAIRHIGPTAQDFSAAFGLSDGDGRYISPIDTDGVALAAIQGLYELLQEKDGEIAALRSEVEAMRGSSGAPAAADSDARGPTWQFVIIGALAAAVILLGGRAALARRRVRS